LKRFRAPMRCCRCSLFGDGSSLSLIFVSFVGDNCLSCLLIQHQILGEEDLRRPLPFLLGVG
jgi:hypothetical protein